MRPVRAKVFDNECFCLYRAHCVLGIMPCGVYWPLFWYKLTLLLLRQRSTTSMAEKYYLYGREVQLLCKIDFEQLLVNVILRKRHTLLHKRNAPKIVALII